MGRKKCKRGECSDFKSNVPLEIVAEILKRVPAESIMRCKCVCKAWNSLLKDNYFVKLHVARLQTNASPSHILLEESTSSCRPYLYVPMNRYLFNVDNHKVRKIEAYPHLSSTSSFGFEDMMVMSSLHGLICFGARYSYYDFPIVVYNPLIRGDYVRLPDPKDPGRIRTANLGYDYSINKYKLVKSLEFVHTPSIYACEVITLGKDTSWRRVDFPYSSIKFCNRGIFHQGSIYWMIRDFDQGCILEFDLTKELFSVLSFPDSVKQPTYRSWGRVQLHTLGEYLNLTERENRVVHIWQLLKQNTGTKFHEYRRMKLESPYKNAVTLGFTYINNNEDLLLLQTRGGFEPVGSNDNTERIRKPGTHYTFYRPAAPDKHIRLTNLPNLESKVAGAKDVRVWSFTPSLVSIKETMHA